MKTIVSQYGQAIIVLLVCAVLFIVTPSIIELGQTILKEDKPLLFNHQKELVTIQKPTLMIKSKIIPQYSTFQYLDFVEEAKDGNNKDLLDKVQFTGQINTAVCGGYTGIFKVRDDYGLQTTVYCSFIVE